MVVMLTDGRVGEFEVHCEGIASITPYQVLG